MNIYQIPDPASHKPLFILCSAFAIRGHMRHLGLGWADKVPAAVQGTVLYSAHYALNPGKHSEISFYCQPEQLPVLANAWQLSGIARVALVEDAPQLLGTGAGLKMLGALH
ncbi:hypothetical protein [Silvimonas iriomotensis]|uniref:Uncharacterized protein n=1 Tax=Silvimonas iriomotensis TaxID=449662 RepID=A0ABQ2PBP4_9NEIS|nr:hypothetical protein [Silvimonas iriomotensis]GGP22675.1 hypothetical protein GCM10010970_26750 [Silvimonas iriomotensis]